VNEVKAALASNIGDRQQQQDLGALLIKKDERFTAHGGVLAVVADGMGGLADGKLASEAAVSTFVKSYAGKKSSESIPAALLRAIYDANSAIASLPVQSSERIGSTLAACVVLNRKLYWISAGDSRIYLIRSNRASHLNEDHSHKRYLLDQVRQGILTRDKAQLDEKKEFLTSFLGRPEIENLDRNITPFTLMDKDSILICSDGIYRLISSRELAALVKGDPDLDCRNLIESVLAHDEVQKDNMTVAVLRVGSSPVTRSSTFSPFIWKWIGLVLALLAIAAGAILFTTRGSKPTAVSTPTAKPAGTVEKRVRQDNSVSDVDKARPEQNSKGRELVQPKAHSVVSPKNRKPDNISPQASDGNFNPEGAVNNGDDSNAVSTQDGTTARQKKRLIEVK
jgi:PPM family protein phosphatase